LASHVMTCWLGWTAPACWGGLNRDGAWNSARPLLGHALELGDSGTHPATTVDMPVTGHFGQRSQESDPRTGRHRATVPSIPVHRHVPTTAGWLRPNQCPTWLEQAENALNSRPLVTGNDGQPSGPPCGRPSSIISWSVERASRVWPLPALPRTALEGRLHWTGDAFGRCHAGHPMPTAWASVASRS
jgi:hypothetical protein